MTPAASHRNRQPRKPTDVLLNDARFHTANAIHSLEEARRELRGDSAERMRVRIRALRRERDRIELFMERHHIGLRRFYTGPAK